MKFQELVCSSFLCLSSSQEFRSSCLCDILFIKAGSSHDFRIQVEIFLSSFSQLPLVKIEKFQCPSEKGWPEDLKIHPTFAPSSILEGIKPFLGHPVSHLLIGEPCSTEILGSVARVSHSRSM